MLSSSSYAWFTSNRIVTINTLNVHVASTGGIEISADGTNWKSVLQLEDLYDVHDTTYITSVNQIPNEMQPVSTSKEVENGFLKMYYGVTENNYDGYYILTSTREHEVEEHGEEATGKFIAFDVFIKAHDDTDLYLTSKSGVTYVGENKSGIAAATRIAFVNEGTLPVGSDLANIQAMKGATMDTVYMWEPNYDVHTATGVSNARDVYGITTTENNATRIIYDGVRSEISSTDEVLLTNSKASMYPNFFRTVNVDYYTKEEFTDFVQVFSLKGGITKIRIYMWIEGQDVDCENNASFADINFDVQLTVNPA